MDTYHCSIYFQSGPNESQPPSSFLGKVARRGSNVDHWITRHDGPFRTITESKKRELLDIPIPYIQPESKGEPEDNEEEHPSPDFQGIMVAPLLPKNNHPCPNFHDNVAFMDIKDLKVSERGLPLPILPAKFDLNNKPRLRMKDIQEGKGTDGLLDSMAMRMSFRRGTSYSRESSTLSTLSQDPKEEHKHEKSSKPKIEKVGVDNLPTPWHKERRKEGGNLPPLRYVVPPHVENPCRGSIDDLLVMSRDSSQDAIPLRPRHYQTDDDDLNDVTEEPLQLFHPGNPTSSWRHQSVLTMNDYEDSDTSV